MPPKDWNELTLVQQPAIDLLVNSLKYKHISGDDFRNTYQTEVILTENLKVALKKINPHIDEVNINKAIRRLTNPEARGASLIGINQALHSDLLNGISLQQDLGSGRKGQTLWYIDFKNPENNEFLVIDEFRVKGHENCRIDLAIFVNGIPLVMIECKSPLLSEPMAEAINQLRRYQNTREEQGKEGCPKLFYTNLLCCGVAREESRYGSILSLEEHYGSWKDPWPLTIEEVEKKIGNSTSQTVLLSTILDKRRLLEILKNYVVFEQEDNRVIKKVCRYQQYRAVEKTMLRLKTKDGGIIWHTQGSGKSLTMLFMGLKLKREMSNPNIVFITDRIDLDQQLHGTFERCGFPNPLRAESCRKLRELLQGATGRTVMTTLHKFGDGEDEFPLSKDDNLYVLIDEAHRSQYKEMAAKVRLALPNAVFIGFTGTPIDKKDKSTMRVFGKYIDQYTIQQAVEDHATVPIYYEGRLAEVKVEGRSLDDLFDIYFRGHTDKEKAAIKQKFGTEKDIMRSPKRIEMICADIIKHYEDFIRPDGFKAQIVANGREAALLYKQTLDRLGGPKSSLIISVSPNDSQAMKECVVEKEEIKNLLKDKFKAPFSKGGDVAFIIVTDMLLTGFDAPIEQVMYLDKPLIEHSLLQAIARCNRTYTGKDHGLIVDYYGLSSNLKEALEVFDPLDIEGVAQPKSQLLPILEAKHMACLQFFSDIDDIDTCVLSLAPEDVRANFKRAFKEFSKALNSILPDPMGLKCSKDHRKLTIIYLETIRRYERVTLTNISDCGEKVKRLIDEHVIAHGINNLTQPVPLFSEGFLAATGQTRSKKAQASEMEHAIKHTINLKFDQDPTFWGSLKEKLDKIIQEYEAKRVDDIHFLEELISIREEAVDKESKSRDEGFKHEAESAIWNAMGQDEKVKKTAMKIYESLSDLIVIDWEQKEDVIKGMRKTVKRKLRELEVEDIEAKTTIIINLLKVHGKKPEVWEQHDQLHPKTEAAEEDLPYGSS